MDGEIKKQCEALYNELGMSLTTAINVFLRQSLLVGDFPFDIKLEQPNKGLLVYLIDDDTLVLTLTHTGTRSDLFGK